MSVLTGYVWSRFEVLGPYGDPVSGVGLESSQSVLEHSRFDNLDLHIVDTDGVHEVGVGGNPGHCTRCAGGSGGFHT